MKLKKVLCAIVAASVMAVSAIPVFAAGINASEKAVLDSLKEGVTVGTQTVYAPDSYITQAENYLNTVDMTEAQSKEILGYVAEVKEAVKADPNADITSLSSATVNKVKDLATKAAKVMGLTLTFNGKTATIVDASGKVVFTGEAAVKATGANADVTNAIVASIAIAGIIAVAGVAIRKYNLAK